MLTFFTVLFILIGVNAIFVVLSVAASGSDSKNDGAHH